MSYFKFFTIASFIIIALFILVGASILFTGVCTPFTGAAGWFLAAMWLFTYWYSGME